MNPIILVLLIASTLFLVKVTLFPSVDANGSGDVVDKAAAKATKKKPVVEGEFTPRKLSQFNGHDEPEIFIAVKGKVYDCTKGRTFYGPSGPYSNFAGHDASRGLAKNSFEMDVIRQFDEPIDDLKDLTEDEWKALNDWESMFQRKYTVVGKLVPETK